MNQELIKAELRMRGYTQARLADEMGVKKSTVSRVISGAGKSFPVQMTIARLLGKEINELWPNQIRLRRTRAEMEADRANTPKEAA
jgi:lambda repressor-like predicted transcriptional regulator